MSLMLEREHVCKPEVRYSPEQIGGRFEGKHIVSMEQFGLEDFRELFETAYYYKARHRNDDSSLMDVCKNKEMLPLFFEPSSRTDWSFQTAMRAMGGIVTTPSNGVNFSSWGGKNESLMDTMMAAGCYTDLIVIRHPEVGSSFEAARQMNWLNQKLDKRTVVISGGDGIGEHPTQGLLDIYTMLEFKGSLEKQNIAFVGDLHHGRTVHSDAIAIAQIRPAGAKVIMVSPESLRMPSEIVERLRRSGVDTYETDDINSVVGLADVIYWTRVQGERFENPQDYEKLKGSFVMTPELLARAKNDAILMHPLPRTQNDMRDHEALDRDPRSVYPQQMYNGKYVRMALIAKVLGRA